MKRFLKSIVILTFLLAFSHYSQAQNVLEINQAASETTSELKKQVKFDSEQEDLIYRSYVLFHKKISQINAMSRQDSNSTIEEKKKVYSELVDNLRNILTEEQFIRFEKIEKNKSQ